MCIVAEALPGLCPCDCLPFQLKVLFTNGAGNAQRGQMAGRKLLGAGLGQADESHRCYEVPPPPQRPNCKVDARQGFAQVGGTLLSILEAAAARMPMHSQNHMTCMANCLRTRQNLVEERPVEMATGITLLA